MSEKSRSILGQIKETIKASDIVVMAVFILVGGFNDYVSCIASALLLPYLFWRIIKSREFKIKLNLFSAAIGVLILCYGLSVLWAIDSGTAFIGFLKYLPVGLYMLVIWQEGNKEKFIELLPYFGAAAALVSLILSFVSQISDMFLVSGRFAGFFQYPNTFALFLLICELLMLRKIPTRVYQYMVLAVLVGCMLYTGSRTVFLLFLASNFVMILANTSKKIRLIILGIFFFAVAAVLLFAYFGPEDNLFSRYLKIGLTESTFVGRILYMTDSLPLLLKYPFGMGYLGYHFVQGSIQTGVYNVSFVHNDFLQVLLDIGIIPGLLFVAGVVVYFFNRRIPFTQKVVVGTLCLHSLFDFNFQFIGMFMLLILLTDCSSKEITLKNITSLKLIIPVVLLLNIYMGIALGLSQFTEYEAADELYPYNTRNKLHLLEAETDYERANALADEILAQNTHYYAPYSIKAKYAYSKGDFLAVIKNKEQVFLKNPFRYTEYKEYCIMLINGINAYEKIGDTKSADILRGELLMTKDKIESNKDRLSSLGRMIDELPVTKLSYDVEYYIENMYGEQNNED